MKSLGYILIKACPDCGSDMELKDSRFGLFYGCVKYPDCESTHGAHGVNTKQEGEPLGIPANKETKQYRIKAHAEFDKLWNGGLMKRPEAYKHLQLIMKLPKDKCHIGIFNIDQCKFLIKELNR